MTKIVTKNSSTASSVPTAAQLVQGELAVNVADKRLYTEDNAGAIVELGTNPSTLTVTGEITANGGIALGDGDKATFGAGDDLQIYHDGSNSYIDDAGTGSLVIRGNDAVYLQKYAGENMLAARADGAVELYHNDALKLATTATGIDVTGTATMDGLVVDGDTDLNGSVTAVNEFKLERTGVTTQYLSIVNGAAVTTFDVANGFSAQYGEYIFNATNSTDTVERMRIDPNGNVGIGCTPNAVADLHVADTSDARIWLDATSADTMELYSGTGVGMFNRSNSYLMLGTNNTERMRIDSGGNVLVGTTDITPGIGDTNAGISMSATNGIIISRANDAPINISRNSSDGALTYFRKDGAIVGSIGSSNGGERLYMVNDSTGLSFLGDFSKILPCDSAGAPRDAAIDLGQGSGGRFKDLYLSGGVYLGGTGAANKLDDYEEGTWTPAVVGGTQTATVQSCTYTKIGRLVSLNAYFTLSDVADTTSLKISGMPFASVSYSATAVPQTGGNESSRPVVVRAEAEQTYFFVWYQDTDAQAQATQAVFDSHFIFSMTYQAA